MKSRHIILGIGGILSLLFITFYVVNSAPDIEINNDGMSENIPLTLYVVNQSFEMSPIDIAIQIDGKMVVDGDFEVENPPNFYPFELQLTDGIHTIHITSELGGVELKKQFEISEEMWASVSYIDDENYSPQFHLKISDDNLEFLNEMEFLTKSDETVMPTAVTNSAADAVITIHGNSDRGSFDNSILQGFLAGARMEMDMDSIKVLKPRFWRIGDFNSNTFVKELLPETKTEIILTEMYEGKAKSKPWKNWDKYEQHVKSLVQYSIDNSPVDYWDIWSEPDGLWSGTTDQFLEMIKRTHNAIRSVDPNAKLVGPGLSHYDEVGYANFLDFLVENNLHFDALSWHEFNIPEEVPIHVASARSMIDSRSSLGPMEIQINEFASGQNHLIPGWTVGWIYYLDAAKVDWANRACWEREIGNMSETSECVKGLDGIFTSDERTPQAIYWVHKFYADMTGTKLDVSVSNPKIVALASKDDKTQEVQVLVGRYSCGQTNAWCTFSANAVADNPMPPVNLEIAFNDYPYASDVNSIKVTLEKIPFSYNSVPLHQPSKLQPYYLDLQNNNNNITIPLANFGDGEVMRLLIEPVK